MEQKTVTNGGPGRRALNVGSRKRARAFPKGRQLDANALGEVRELLGSRPRRPDLLIEFLHLIQDRYHYLSARHLRALCDEMRLPQAAVYEVATFYSHFDVVKEGETPPPPTTIRVCDSITCELKGAETLLASLKACENPSSVRVIRAPCMGRCDTAPVCEVGHLHVDYATVDSVQEVLESGRREPEIPAYQDLAEYRAAGGYSILESCRSGARNVDAVIAELSDGGLKGLGGAGFPTGRKWQIVRSYPGPRLMTINGDEGEPGTFKDRFYLERDPHRFIEGMLIGAWVVEAKEVYFYLRDEYPEIRLLVEQELAKAEKAGLTKFSKVIMRRGAGAYICGEESAMIESIEGKRGLPRHRPPYVAQVGLFGRPTLEHNVETLFWIRDIIEKGPAWFTSQGRRERKGFRSFSVSGRVKNPGVKLAPAGISIQELIDEYCGGMAEGETFKGYLPGGASGGILPASMNDIPLDFGTLEKYGCFIGSHAVVVLSDKDDMKAVALNLMKFFEDESCGQCTPCRAGTEKAAKLMAQGPWNEALLTELSNAMRDASICGLGQAASNPLSSVFKYFRDDLTKPLRQW